MPSYTTLTRSEVDKIAVLVENFIVQSDISANKLAKMARVSQPMVHRIVHRNIKKMTPNIERLILYVRMKPVSVHTESFSDLNEVLSDYITAGGTVGELRAIIIACTHSRYLNRSA